ncbi:hypothetical protein MGALJ_09980 [Mycobacterium gallinarum]|uniref:DUF2742 domain-containing protein n=1 Tax=Mycobacterium gallinarum TaxID=39689 RepID=A0A9W4FDW9_9MYCO|nr:hypothetical protein MGALJ_09980 [Mycobacterium gallinarum]
MTYELASQQVSWADVHAFVLPKLKLVGDWPMLGSPAWCGLDDRDRVKWASVLDAAQHWALRLEHGQIVSCEASHDVSSAGDWLKVARDVRRGADYFAARPWMKRGANR